MSITAESRPHHFAPGQSLHLTRRGRLVLLGIPALAALAGVLIGLMLLLSSWGNQVQAGSTETDGPLTQEVTVTDGDTLWSIALGSGASGDPHTVIEQIAELNALETSELQPGQEIFVPAQ